MRQIASLALALALFAAPAALAADCAGHASKTTCCAKKEGAATAEKKCDPATCKDAKKCTPEEKAKCAASCQKKSDAPAAPAAPKS
jgi:hypothetical protein